MWMAVDPLQLNSLCSAFYKNMVRVAKCVTYNKVLYIFFFLKYNFHRREFPFLLSRCCAFLFT